MRKFAASRLELRLLKSEAQRVYNGHGFLYEQRRIEETEKILNSIHNRIALRRVRKAVFYKRELKTDAGV